MKPRWITTECEARFELKNGSLVWVTIYLNTAADSQGWRYIVRRHNIFGDGFKSITEAKRAAEKAVNELDKNK